MRQFTIRFREDDQLIRDAMLAILSEGGSRVLIAGDGYETVVGLVEQVYKRPERGETGGHDSSDTGSQRGCKRDKASRLALSGWLWEYYATPTGFEVRLFRLLLIYRLRKENIVCIHIIDGMFNVVALFRLGSHPWNTLEYHQNGKPLASKMGSFGEAAVAPIFGNQSGESRRFRAHLRLAHETL